MRGELVRLYELSAKVEGFFARVASRRPGALACGPGCHACCAPGLTLTRLEADRLREHLGALPAALRDELRAQAGSPREGRCAALDGGGRCGIYAARPMVCRSHGLPIRLTDAKTRLPVVDACPLNFVGEDLAELPAELVLDQETLSTVLGALELAHTGSLGVEPAREDLRTILAG